MNTSTQREAKGLTPVEPLQMTLLGPSPLSIKGIIDRADVLAPLVSVEPGEKDNQKFLNIMVTVLIPTPILGSTPLKLYLENDTEPREISLLITFDSKEKEPEFYHPWFVCYRHFTDPGTEDLLTVKTVIENIGIPTIENARTKRGTVTQVLRS